MKKMILISVFFVIIAVSCKIETNFPEEAFGKVIVYNMASSGRTITRITVSENSLSSSKNIYNDIVSIPPGGNSKKYKLELYLIYDILFSSYRVTVTLDDSTTKFVNIRAYEDIMNNLYLDDTEFIER